MTGQLVAVVSGYSSLTGFTGHLQTEPTGLIYMRGRFYSPAWHRFMNSNQGVDPNYINQFGYVCGDPLRSTDPTGLDVFGPGGNDGPQRSFGPQRSATLAQLRRDLLLRGALNFGLGVAKIAAAAALAATTGESGIGAVAAAYTAVSGAGNLSAGVSQIAGAISGNIQAGITGANVSAAATSVAGVGTVIATGDINLAARNAAWEGIITTAATHSVPSTVPSTSAPLQTGIEIVDTAQNLETVVNDLSEKTKNNSTSNASTDSDHSGDGCGQGNANPGWH